MEVFMKYRQVLFCTVVLFAMPAVLQESTSNDPAVTAMAQTSDLSRTLSVCESDYKEAMGSNRRLTLENQSLKTENQNLKKSNEDSNRQLTEKQSKIATLQQQLNQTKDQLNTSARTILNISEQLSALRDVKSIEPGELFSLAKTSQEESQQGDLPVATTYEENGKKYIIRDLVIGTLKLEYDKNVHPGEKVTLKAAFIPHPVLNLDNLPPASEEKTIWYMKLEYNSQKSKVSYNELESGNKPQSRIINPRAGEEVWAWDIVAPKEFRLDSSDLFMHIGYKLGNQNDNISIREKVEFSEITVPGLWSKAVTAIKDNLTYILGVLSAIIGIYAAIVSTQKTK